MFGFNTQQETPETLLSHLKDFEMFCLGKKEMSPDKFKSLNVELSISAVEHIGERHIRKEADGKHLIWIGPDKREHDLGLVDESNVIRDYPGFHRTRSLSLGHDQVVENDMVDVPTLRRQVSMVKMKDGSTGLGPNYKMALRNAALKMFLKRECDRLNRMDIWDRFYGRA